MAIVLSTNFDISGKVFLDSRQSVKTLEDLEKLNVSKYAEGFEIYVIGEHSWYTLDESGAWKKRVAVSDGDSGSGGGGVGINAQTANIPSVEAGFVWNAPGGIIEDIYYEKSNTDHKSGYARVRNSSQYDIPNIKEGDLCCQVYHHEDAEKNETSDDENSLKFKGFATVVFKITEIPDNLTNTVTAVSEPEKDYTLTITPGGISSVFKFEIISGPSLAINTSWAAFGNMTDSTRQCCSYRTNNTTRYLKDMKLVTAGQPIIGFGNISAQFGNLGSVDASASEVSGLELGLGSGKTLVNSGYTNYLTDIYVRGNLKQVNNQGIENRTLNFRGDWTSADTYYFNDEVYHSSTKALYYWNDESGHAGSSEVPGSDSRWIKVSGIDGISESTTEYILSSHSTQAEMLTEVGTSGYAYAWSTTAELPTKEYQYRWRRTQFKFESGGYSNYTYDIAGVYTESAITVDWDDDAAYISVGADETLNNLDENLVLTTTGYMYFGATPLPITGFSVDDETELTTKYPGLSFEADYGGTEAYLTVTFDSRYAYPLPQSLAVRCSITGSYAGVNHTRSLVYKINRLDRGEDGCIYQIISNTSSYKIGGGGITLEAQMNKGSEVCALSKDDYSFLIQKPNGSSWTPWKTTWSDLADKDLTDGLGHIDVESGQNNLKVTLSDTDLAEIYTATANNTGIRVILIECDTIENEGVNQIYDIEEIPFVRDGQDGVSLSNIFEYYCVTKTPTQPSYENNLTEGIDYHVWYRDVTDDGQPNYEPTDPDVTATFSGVNEAFPYLWNYEMVFSSDTALEDRDMEHAKSVTAPVIIGRWSKDGRSIVNTTDYYASQETLSVNPPSGVPTSEGLSYYSGDTAPDITGTWRTSAINPGNGVNYIWNFEVIEWNTSPYYTTTSPKVICAQGSGIAKIREYYLIDDRDDRPTYSNDSDADIAHWTEVGPDVYLKDSDGDFVDLDGNKVPSGVRVPVPVPTKERPYLWNFEISVDTKGNNVFISEPVIKSFYSEDGRSFLGSFDFYQVGNSQTTPPYQGQLETLKTYITSDYSDKDPYEDLDSHHRPDEAYAIEVPDFNLGWVCSADTGFTYPTTSDTNRHYWNFEMIHWSKPPYWTINTPHPVGSQGLKGDPATTYELVLSGLTWNVVSGLPKATTTGCPTAYILRCSSTSSSILPLGNGVRIAASYNETTISSTDQGAKITNNKFSLAFSEGVSINDDVRSIEVYAYVDGVQVDSQNITLLKDGAADYIANVFKRTNDSTRPASPIDGTYEAPLSAASIAAGWEDGIPQNGGKVVWMSKRKFYTDASNTDNWSTPVVMSDTDSLDVEYSWEVSFTELSIGESQEGKEKKGWFDSPNEDPENGRSGSPIWMATSTCVNGIWTNWTYTRVLGEKGESALSVILSNTNMQFSANATGTPENLTSKTSEIQVYRGIHLCTVKEITATSDSDLQGFTITKDGAKITVTPKEGEIIKSGTIKLEIEYYNVSSDGTEDLEVSEVTTTQNVQVTMPSESIYAADLDNETDTIQLGSDGILQIDSDNFPAGYASIKTKFSLFYGTEIQELESLTALVNGESSDEKTGKKTWEVTADKDTGEVEVKLYDGYNCSRLDVTITGKGENGGEGIKIFSLTSLNSGVDGCISYLMPNVSYITYSQANKSYSPSTVSCSAFDRLGTKDPKTSSYHIFYKTDDDGTSHSYTGPISTSGIKEKITFILRTDSDTVIDTETVPLIIQGTEGKSVISADLSNETDSIHLGSDGKLQVPEGQEGLTFETTYTLSYGTTPQPLTAFSATLNNLDASYKNEITIKAEQNTGKVTVTLLPGFEPNGETVEVLIKAQCAQGGTNWYEKVFSIVGINSGVDGQIDYLVPSHTSILYSQENNSLSPDTITCVAKSRVGNKPAGASEGFIYYKIDGASSYTKYSEGIPTSTINSQIEFALFETDSYSSTCLDTETVPLIIQGTEGTSPCYVDLSNEMDSIHLGDDGVLQETQTINTHLSVKQGTSSVSLTGLTAVKKGTMETFGTGWSVTCNKDAGYDNVSLSLEEGYSEETLTLEITGTTAKGSFTKDFTLISLSDGQDGQIDYVCPSVSVIKKDANGTFTPTTITCTAYSRAGGQTPVAITDPKYSLSYKIGDSGSETAYLEAIASSGVSQSITFILRYDGTEIDRETVPLVIDGIGSYVADLSNEADSIQLGEDGTLQTTEPIEFTTHFSLFKGTESQNLTDLKVKVGSVPAETSASGTGWSVTADKNDTQNNVKITLTNGYATPRLEVKVIGIYDSQEFSKVFTLTGLKGGKDGYIDYLVPEATSIKVNKSNTKSPDTLTCLAYRRSGNSAPVPSDLSIFYTIDSQEQTNATKYSDADGVLTKDVQSGVTFYLAECLENDLMGPVYDKETVPIVADGTDGIGSYMADLSNETDTVQLGNDGVLDHNLTNAFTTVFSIWYGKEKQTLSSLTVSCSPADKVTATRALASGTVTVSLKDGFSGSGKVTITGKCADMGSTLSKDFTIRGIKGGQDGCISYIVPSVDALVLDGSSTYTISCSQWKRQGSGTPQKSNDFWLSYVKNGTESELSKSSEITFNGSLTSKITFKLRSSESKDDEENVIDQETIPVLSNPVQADLSNETDTIMLGSDGVLQTQKSFSTILSVFSGTTDVSGDYTIGSLSATPTVSGMETYYTLDTSGKQVTVTLKTGWKGSLSVTIPASSEKGYPGVSKTFTITGINAGTDGQTSYLNPNASVIKNSGSGELVPNTLTVAQMKQIGSGTPQESDEYWITYKIDDGYEIKPSNGKVSEFTVPDEALKSAESSISFYLWSASPSSITPGILLDTETVPIIKDGATGPAGTAALSADLSNETDTFGVGADGVYDGPNNLWFYTDFTMYQGTTEQTISGGVTVSGEDLDSNSGMWFAKKYSDLTSTEKTESKIPVPSGGQQKRICVCVIGETSGNKTKFSSATFKKISVDITGTITNVGSIKKTFTLTPSKDGADGQVDYLSLGFTAIKVNSSGTSYDPSLETLSEEVSAYSRVGSGTPSPLSFSSSTDPYCIKCYIDGSTTGHDISAISESGFWSDTKRPENNLVFKLTDRDGTITYDTETVLVLRDGANGASGTGRSQTIHGRQTFYALTSSSSTAPNVSTHAYVTESSPSVSSWLISPTSDSGKTPIFSTRPAISNGKYLWTYECIRYETIEYSGTTEKTKTYSFNALDWQCHQGANGLTGAVIRMRGQWKALTTYTNDDKYIDVVLDNKRYYKCLTTHTSTSTRESAKWEEFTQYENVATNVLLANQGYVDILGAGSLFVGDSTADVKDHDSTTKQPITTDGSTLDGWVMTKGSIKHTKTGLELTKDGRLYDPTGLSLRVGGKNLTEFEPNLLSDPTASFDHLTTTNSEYYKLVSQSGVSTFQPETPQGATVTYNVFEAKTFSPSGATIPKNPYGENLHALVLNVVTDRANVPEGESNAVNAYFSPSTKILGSDTRVELKTSTWYSYSFWTRLSSYSLEDGRPTGSEYTVTDITAISTAFGHRGGNEILPILNLTLYTAKTGGQSSSYQMTFRDSIETKNISGTLAKGKIRYKNYGVTNTTQDGWYQVSTSFCIDSGTSSSTLSTAQFEGNMYLEISPYFKILGEEYQTYIFFAGQKLEESELPSDFSSSLYNQIAGFEDGLLETGIDIANRKIQLTADSFNLRNNSGDQTMFVDQMGNVNISGQLNTPYFRIDITNLPDVFIPTWGDFYTMASGTNYRGTTLDGKTPKTYFLEYSYNGGSNRYVAAEQKIVPWSNYISHQTYDAGNGDYGFAGTEKAGITYCGDYVDKAGNPRPIKCLTPYSSISPQTSNVELQDLNDRFTLDGPGVPDGYGKYNYNPISSNSDDGSCRLMDLSLDVMACSGTVQIINPIIYLDYVISGYAKTQKSNTSTLAGHSLRIFLPFMIPSLTYPEQSSSNPNYGGSGIRIMNNFRTATNHGGKLHLITESEMKGLVGRTYTLVTPPEQPVYVCFPDIEFDEELGLYSWTGIDYVGLTTKRTTTTSYQPKLNFIKLEGVNNSISFKFVCESIRVPERIGAPWYTTTTDYPSGPFEDSSKIGIFPVVTSKPGTYLTVSGECGGPTDGLGSFIPDSINS